MMPIRPAADDVTMPPLLAVWKPGPFASGLAAIGRRGQSDWTPPARLL